MPDDSCPCAIYSRASNKHVPRAENLDVQATPHATETHTFRIIISSHEVSPLGLSTGSAMIRKCRIAFHRKARIRNIARHGYFVAWQRYRNAAFHRTARISYHHCKPWGSTVPLALSTGYAMTRKCRTRKAGSTRRKGHRTKGAAGVKGRGCEREWMRSLNIGQPQ